ncbi:hypothetical protein [Actinokineospora globicatena]|uniref:Secreted protein n=1 Tax=Actinokineospora globicatena TaxID=103729 RepID=A0A9W6QJ28_9PSEU|nr:hypothetical protein [Actinokineospora globicatena]GLW90402.1 hypothetical protein Aglo03_12180 [Actinokineospora globicatena]
MKRFAGAATAVVLSVGLLVGAAGTAGAKQCTPTDEVKETYTFAYVVDGTSVYVYVGSNGGKYYSSKWRGDSFNEC